MRKNKTTHDKKSYIYLGGKKQNEAKYIDLRWKINAQNIYERYLVI